VKYYELSAEQGNAQVQYNLAVCYENGRGVPKDLNKAAKYYQLSSENEISQAEQKLAICTGSGDLGKNISEVYDYYKLVEKQSQSPAFPLLYRDNTRAKCLVM